MTGRYLLMWCYPYDPTGPEEIIRGRYDTVEAATDAARQSSPGHEVVVWDLETMAVAARPGWVHAAKQTGMRPRYEFKADGAHKPCV